MEMAQVVAKKLVMEIVPIFDLPISLGSDSGPAFMAKLSQLLSKFLKLETLLYVSSSESRKSREND